MHRCAHALSRTGEKCSSRYLTGLYSELNRDHVLVVRAHPTVATFSATVIPAVAAVITAGRERTLLNGSKRIVSSDPDLFSAVYVPF